MSKSAIKRLIRDGVNSMGGKQLDQGYFYSNKGDKEIYHASSYELRAFKLLEKDEKVKVYDTCKFSIRYEFQGMLPRYLPDIHVTYTNGVEEIIEVKPNHQLMYPINQAKFKAAIPYCQERGWKFSVWTEKELGMKIRASQSSS